ncbi:MAG TPA: hypothetical protein VG758_01190 [Hyphomicrobiaceae bacterium]|nr:hypothetical protein [Hyphomicrobiaceae bacterium]
MKLAPAFRSLPLRYPVDHLAEALHAAMTTYLFDNAAEDETAKRFASVDALYNFRTFRFLETAGIGPGWHCLEVGGGSGAVAAWMAERVRPSRSVLGRQAHLELRRHDDPLPEEAFDLIHARLVLCTYRRGIRRSRGW